LIVFDFHGEYLDPRLLRAESLEDLKRFLSENYTEKTWAVVWTPKRMSEVPYFLQICYNMKNCWVILEEVNARDIGNVRQPDPVFLDLVNFGRNRGVSLICVAKRPAQVSRDLTSQADIIISFKQDEPNDIKYLQEFCGKNVEEETTGLSDHEWAIVYPAIDPEKGE